MKDRITLELSEDEILMIQELVKIGHEKTMPPWEWRILYSLSQKALEAYDKSGISKTERDRRINAEREKWSRLYDAEIGDRMALAKRRELDFYFKIEEEAETDDTDTTGDPDKTVPVTGEV